MEGRRAQALPIRSLHGEDGPGSESPIGCLKQEVFRAAMRCPLIPHLPSTSSASCAHFVCTIQCLDDTLFNKARLQPWQVTMKSGIKI